MKIFEEREVVADMIPCRKKPIVVHHKVITEEFRVRTMEGDYKLGKPGDVLMRGVDGELYICDRAIFEATYDVLPNFDQPS